MIVGIGPARSGTTSLQRLLKAQGLEVGHESTTSLPWQMDRPRRWKWALQDLRDQDGDVACWLTQAAPRLLRETDCKVIALKRPREDTVESLCEHFDGLRIRASKPFGPMCFPTIEGGTLQEAWGEYWDACRRIYAKITAAYPNRVLMVRTYELEQEAEQQRIAAFLGIDEWTHISDCHHNTR